MATTLFNPEYTLVSDLSKDLISKTRGKVVVKIANNSFTYNLYNTVSGTQPFRTQVDVTLDGKMKLLSGGKALGDIKLHMLEPDQLCSSNNSQTPVAVTHGASRLVGNVASINRQITVTFPGTRFNGVITSVSPSVSDIDGKGTFLQTTIVTASGTWETT